MEKVIIFDVSYHENRVAVLEDDKLVEIYVERPLNHRLVGNIYKGVIKRVLPGMQSAFVDIGHVKNAFLHVSDVEDDCAESDDEMEYSGKVNKSKYRKIEDYLKEGQEITVQVVKEAIGTKGPRITTNLTLPGRSMVLMPCANYTGISRRITDEKERTRLKVIARKIKSKKMGLIIRTAAENIPEQRLAREKKYLMKEWTYIRTREKTGKVPRLLYEEPGLLKRTLRDSMTDDVGRLVLNNRLEYKSVIKFLRRHNPKLQGRVELIEDGYDVFESFAIEQEIDKALSNKVWIKNGAYLIIDKTEALTVIDVNTGKFTGKKNLEDTVYRVNMNAAVEIARQLRLRDIGGIIVIDFIDMMKEDHRRNLIANLEEALTRDKTKTEVFGMTKLGLIEMTRKKVREELQINMKTDCPTCDGYGKVMSKETISRSLEKQLISYLAHTDKKRIEVKLSDEIIGIFAGIEEGNIRMLEKTYKKKLLLIPDTKLALQDIRIREI